jgi:parallel beta-helix repeat protein
MKKLLAISSLILLAGLFLHACGIIPNANTSFVTITIGDSQRATLHAEKATTWSRFKYFLADAKLMPEAQAYIPSVVQIIVVTVTAADITTPIVAIDDVSNKTSTTIRFEVPNGANRKFTIEGYHGATNLVTYQASTETNLDGREITLPISMQFNYYGKAIFVDSANGNNLNSGLTYTSALQTITRALSLQSTSVPYNTIPVIWVEQGNYTSASGEQFPLRLNPGTALLCGGKGFTSAIGDSTAGIRVLGNNGASIDNCKILVKILVTGGPGSSTGISDDIGAQAPSPTNMKVNGSLIEISGGSGGSSQETLIGIRFIGDSTMIESVVTGTGLHVSAATGVSINGGQPQIINGAVSNIISSYGIPCCLNVGNGVAVNSGNAIITGNVIQGNVYGIAVTNASPAISNNTLTANYIGVDIITATGDPHVNANRIYCNGAYDVGVNSNQGAKVFDLTNNSWDHDATTNPPGPLVSSIPNQGYDIFVSSQTPTPTPIPQYVPFSAAVTNGCSTAPFGKQNQ